MTDEEMRLQAVQATGLLDTPAEGRFDRITRIARRLTNTSISTITLVDQDTVAERIRQAVERAPIKIPDSAPLQVTLSLGTSHAVCRPGYSPKLEALAKAAVLALYEAKRNGRNQVAQARELKSV